LLVYGDYIPLIKRIITPILLIVNEGADLMIIFDKLWVTMEKKGVSTYQLRERCGIDSKTVRRLRANDNIETKTLDKLCTALNCKLEDIAEYIS
jgi:DNA-binding Xre family transcriptional regulator